VSRAKFLPRTLSFSQLVAEGCEWSEVSAPATEKADSERIRPLYFYDTDLDLQFLFMTNSVVVAVRAPMVCSRPGRIPRFLSPQPLKKTSDVLHVDHSSSVTSFRGTIPKSLSVLLAMHPSICCGIVCCSVNMLRYQVSRC